MSNIITSCAVTQMEGKKRKLKDVGDGYVEVLIGAFGLFVNGYHWDFNNSITKQFQPGAELQANVTDGKCFAESDHPEMSEFIDGIRSRETVITLFNDRLTKIMQSKVSGHYRKMALIDLSGENKKDKLVGVMAQFKPMTEVETARIHTPDINPAYSIRAFSDQYQVAGIFHQCAKHIINYDSVTRGGVGIADKYNTPTLQSAGFVTPDNLVDFSRNNIYTGDSVLQSGEPLVSVAKIRTSLGWADVPVHNVDSGAINTLSRWRGM